MATYADLHALNFDVLDILRVRHTNDRNYKSRALQYVKFEMKMHKKFSPNSARTNSIYYMDARVSYDRDSHLEHKLTTTPVSSLFPWLTVKRKGSAQKRGKSNPSNARRHTRMVRKLGMCRYQSRKIHGNIQVG